MNNKSATTLSDTLLEMLLNTIRPLLAFYLEEALQYKKGTGALSLRHLQVYSNSLTIMHANWLALKKRGDFVDALKTSKEKRMNYEKSLSIMEDLRKCFANAVLEQLEDADEDLVWQVVDQNNWKELNAEA